jgi:hypothetical protein
VVSETGSFRDQAASVRDVMAALRQLHARDEGDSPQATMLRVLWLRSDHEDARIATELTHLQGDLVVFHATVTLANGASASGYAVEPLRTAERPAATIERCETRAIGRALDVLGYIVSATGDARAMPDSTPIEVESPGAPDPVHSPTAAEAEPPASRNAPPMVVNALRNVSLRRRGTEELPGAGIDPDTGEIIGPVEAPQVPEAAAASPPSSASTADAARSESPDDLPLEDYTWTHFWKWARAHELTTKVHVEKRLGHSIDGLTPAEVRLELQKHGIPL